MTYEELNKLLLSGVVRVTFTKKSDGSTRVMRCTRHPDVMPPPPPPKVDSNGAPIPPRPMPEGHVLVWDLEAAALRSFDIATLTSDPVLIEGL